MISVHPSSIQFGETSISAGDEAGLQIGVILPEIFGIWVAVDGER